MHLQGALGLDSFDVPLAHPHPSTQIADSAGNVARNRLWTYPPVTRLCCASHTPDLASCTGLPCRFSQ
jgi:hypothetical protein